MPLEPQASNTLFSKDHARIHRVVDMEADTPEDSLLFDSAGNAVFGGNVSADNLSGTNTGDQTLPTRDSLGLDTDDTVTFANLSGNNTGDQTLPVKASGAEVDTGTDDAKFATAKAIADSKLSYTDGAETLTNKRITKRVVTTADDATAVIDVDVTDQYQLTAMANATTISTTGTPTAGQKLMIRLKDNGTARALTWDGVFRAIGVTAPTTTTISKTLYIGCVYNLTDTKWDILAVGQEV